MATVTEGDTTIAAISTMVYIQEIPDTVCLMVEYLLRHLSDYINFDIMTCSMLIEKCNILSISSKISNAGIKNIVKLQNKRNVVRRIASTVQSKYTTEIKRKARLNPKVVQDP